MLSERSYKEIKYYESTGLRDYGIFRLSTNLIKLSPFENLVDPDLADDQSFVLNTLYKHAKISPSAIPLEIIESERPPTAPFTAYDESFLSCAELAGVSTAVSLYAERDQVFFCYWGINRNITDLFGNLKIQKKGRRTEISYQTGSWLKTDFGITTNQDTNKIVIAFGRDLKLELARGKSLVSSSGKIDRVDLHSFIGFCKEMYLFNAVNHALTPKLAFARYSLAPYFKKGGIRSVEEIVRIDRIKSYL